MRFRHLILLVLSIIVVGVAAGLLQARLGASPMFGKLFVISAVGAAFLYLERRGRRARDLEEARPKEARPREPYVSPFEVRFDDDEVLVTRNGEFFERVAWDDLVTVGVHIDSEAFLPEPWWMLFGRGSKHAHYPSDARGAREMLPELQRRLPGFDNEGVIRAMGLFDGGVVLWKRTA
jgi:hypothetical protein